MHISLFRGAIIPAASLLLAFLSALLLPALGCGTTAGVFPPPCELTAPIVDAPALPGDAVWAVTGPLSTVNDTIVTVGTSQAAVLVVERTGCDDLDTCRSDNSCDVCTGCDTCAADEAACVQRVKFTVPDVSPGDQALLVRNAYGSSGEGVLTVLGDDTQAVDTGDSAP